MSFEHTQLKTFKIKKERIKNTRSDSCIKKDWKVCMEEPTYHYLSFLSHIIRNHRLYN